MKKAQGRGGRPPASPARTVVDRIKRERAARRSLAAIAEALNADGVPKAQGGKRWTAPGYA